jgi:lipopolysaccharide export system permease protein
MPLIWRYLLRSYFQTLGLCVSGFIGVLLVMRFQEIARFASSGAPKLTIFLFTLYLIPLILGYAIPISCLIAAILLFQKLSHSHELTALRAAGLGIKPIIYPLILAGFLLSLINFTIMCEISPRARTLSKELIYESTALNPLVLLQKDTMIKLKDVAIDMKSLEAGRRAKDVIAIINNRSNGRLGLMIAKELSLEKETLSGKEVSLISSVDANKEGIYFDHLVIENQRTMSTHAANLSRFIQNADWLTNDDYLNLRMLLAKETLQFKGGGIHRTHEEIVRRFSISFAAFTFTLIGIAFGMEISRNRSKKGMFWAIGLAIFFLICFMSAKSLRHTPALSICVYLLPHPVIILLTIRPFKRIAGGLE